MIFPMRIKLIDTATKLKQIQNTECLFHQEIFSNMKKIIFGVILILNSGISNSQTDIHNELFKQQRQFILFSRNDSVFLALIYYYKKVEFVVDSIKINFIQYPLMPSKFDSENMKKYRRSFPSNIYKIVKKEIHADYPCVQTGIETYISNGTTYKHIYFGRSVWKIVVQDKKSNKKNKNKK